MTRRRRQLPIRRNIELLATIQETGDGQGAARRIFGNIIELGGRALILEASSEIRVGASVDVRVVFPGQPRGDDPFAHLLCSVRKVRNDPEMHYDLSIIDMDEQTHDRLELYLNRAGTGWGG